MVTFDFDCVASIVNILTTVGARLNTVSLLGSFVGFVSISLYDGVAVFVMAVLSVVTVPLMVISGVLT